MHKSIPIINLSWYWPILQPVPGWCNCDLMYIQFIALSGHEAAKEDKMSPLTELAAASMVGLLYLSTNHSPYQSIKDSNLWHWDHLHGDQCWTNDCPVDKRSNPRINQKCYHYLWNEKLSNDWWLVQLAITCLAEQITAFRESHNLLPRCQCQRTDEWRVLGWDSLPIFLLGNQAFTLYSSCSLKFTAELMQHNLRKTFDKKMHKKSTS